MKTEGKHGKLTSNIEPRVNNSTDATYNCPTCGRPTLSGTTNEIVDFECGVCGQRVREEEAAV
jgi:transcription elongation factor Elf1